MSKTKAYCSFSVTAVKLIRKAPSPHGGEGNRIRKNAFKIPPLGNCSCVALLTYIPVGIPQGEGSLRYSAIALGLGGDFLKR